MQSWISNMSSVMTPWIALAAVVLGAIKLWMEIRANAAMSSDIAALKRKFVVRNWAPLLVLACGTAAMCSVALVPLSPSSVLVALVGAVGAAAGFAGVLVLEVQLTLADRVATVLAACKCGAAESP